ncbi:hypothetical protein [Streptomyces sp. NPDC057325]|uniref:hypothetical protein n=1 Tax=unclassified Streptomyces TaxID=2593676 RepID=UPI003642CFE5
MPRAVTTRSASTFRAVPLPVSTPLAPGTCPTHAHVPDHPTAGRAESTPLGPPDHAPKASNRGPAAGLDHAAPNAVRGHASSGSAAPSGAVPQMFRR